MLLTVYVLEQSKVLIIPVKEGTFDLSPIKSNGIENLFENRDVL